MTYTSLIVVKEGNKNHIKIYYSHEGIIRFKTNVYVKDKDQFSKDRDFKKSNAVSPSTFQVDKEKIEDIKGKLDAEIKDFEKEHLQKPTKAQLMSLINSYKAQTQRTYTYVSDYLTEYNLSFEKKDDNQKSLYSSFCSALFQFFTYKNRNYFFKEIDKRFIQEFIDYLLFKKPKISDVTKIDGEPVHQLNDDEPIKFDPRFGMNNNTLLKRLDTFKSFLLWVGREKKIKLDYTTITKAIKDVTSQHNISEYDNIQFAFKRMDEVRKLAEKQFEDLIKDDRYEELRNGEIKFRGVSRDILIRAKDFFLISILTGNRLSDLKAIKKHHVILGKQTAKKTKNQFLLNSNESAIQLLEKHNFSLKMPDTKYNKCIKVFMKQFYHDYLNQKDNTVIQIERRGKHEQIEMVEYYTLASSHSGRRSFATIAYNESDKTKRAIMQFTGHTSEQEFDKYIQLEPEQDKEDMALLMTL
ncbi:phage integrase SAM-like domain-containing protein [Rufibacter immobilis]|uniref:phage integrase SAM-like domain-containing protein n=1 Tax=Rufibacter immobilis TaxID=1348778 RepID=UPI0035E4EFC3